MKVCKYILGLFLLIYCIDANAFNHEFDKSLINFSDKEKVHSPHKATVLSAVLPGAGQVYNKKYWKVPIVYAGLGGLTYSIVYNQREFRSFQNELTARIDGNIGAQNPKYAGVPDSYLASNRNSYRNNRDLSIVGLAIFYVLNIVDATVDAHLYNFDVNKDLSIGFDYPAPLSNQMSTIFAPQIGITYRF